MDFREFEETVRKLDRNKYHIGRILGFVDGVPKIEKWDIFRKDMPDDKYFSENNEAVLSSDKGNTIEDIKKLIEEEK